MDITYEQWLGLTCLLLIAIGWFALLWSWFGPKPKQDDWTAARKRRMESDAYKTRFGAR